MSHHDRASSACKVTIKAFQNIAGSLRGFERLLASLASNDQLLLSSLFCFAVTKYAKPFIETVTPFGKVKFSIRGIKKHTGFSMEVHTHLIELRNTLIAHDDLESIEPRILEFCMRLDGTEFNIPVSIAVSNKCLSYPIDTHSLLRLRNHVQAAAQATHAKLEADLLKLREVSLQFRTDAEKSVRYQKNYGHGLIDKVATPLTPPDFMSDEWLRADQPDFTSIHSGLLYEELRIRKDFHGPEVIKLPNGTELHISPVNFGSKAG